VATALAAGKRWSSKSLDTEPGDEAPAKVLIEYWQKRPRSASPPSDQSRWRLLNAVLEEPRFYSHVLDLLPDTPQAHDAIKHFLDQFDDSNNRHELSYSQESRESLRKWLSRHSSYCRDFLVKNAKQADEQDEFLRDDPDLEALARFDWQAAKPIIEGFSNSSSPNVAAYALGLLYTHALTSGDTEVDVLRDRLKGLVTERNSRDRVREIGVKALMRNDWPGRDVWFLSLFGESLPARTKNGDELDFLKGPIESDPDRWIPILTELVRHKNPNVHNAAVFCLSQFNRERARADALRPLVPWLSNPNWANAGDEFTRARVIDSMALVPMPESFPGLLAIVQNERELQRSSAADVLAKLRDRRAIPVLRRAIEKATSEDDYAVERLIVALIACDGLNDAEKLKSIEAIAAETNARVMRSGGRRFFIIHDSKSVQGAIGQVLVQQETVSDSIAAAVVRRSKELRRSKASVAEKLWLIALKWNLPSVNTAIAERIADGSVDLDTLLTGLERRENLGDASGILKSVISLGSYAAGVSAVVLSDTDAKTSILKSEDTPAIIALLGCARMVRDDLPIELAARLLGHRDSKLRLATERYLESVDSQEARKLVRAQRPGEILIQGARGVFDPKDQYRDEWVKWEKQLVDDVRNKRAEEVFGEIEFYYSDTAPFIRRQSVEIRVRAHEAEVCKRNDQAREECRALRNSELEALHELFAEASFDNLTPISLDGFGTGGTEQEFVRITKNGGRRVYTANLNMLHYQDAWSLQLRTPHERLEAFYNDLKKTGDFELRYAARQNIKDLEVLVSDDRHPVRCVCAESGELRVLVKDKDEDWQAIRKGQKNDSLNWHVLTDGKIGGLTGQPRACEVLDDYDDIPDTGQNRIRLNRENSLWQIKVGDGFVRVETFGDKEGIWLCREGREPKLIAEGFYFNPVVTPDAVWLVAVKRLNHEDSLVRIDLRTNREYAVETDNFYYPVIRVPGSSKVLFTHEKGGEDEHSLLDPATGAIEVIKGECEPIEHQSFRPLQPISGSQEYWAAIPDFKATTTRVGRYDARAFKFTSIIELPGIGFTSQNMWIDETAHWLYLAYNGHLLRLPFTAKGK
jgi:hypothetical protein